MSASMPSSGRQSEAFQWSPNKLSGVKGATPMFVGSHPGKRCSMTVLPAMAIRVISLFSCPDYLHRSSAKPAICFRIASRSGTSLPSLAQVMRLMTSAP